ncbi:helix-turn-helix domain-containing protein [Tranquillimonas alkanivorans]|uniref:Transcriptional regulator, AraC family n=1 Tax=Tranquillimonas alkanivorans TaxID=441119 RepID=A0A1I5NQ50_9RHOB|nr:helix-turn-helix domain-containing protein [Tranquillimonas alkanivorans]SFP23361.1 transcriptional regulator, AraC family [Tranquillimonas alkanivorans]
MALRPEPQTLIRSTDTRAHPKPVEDFARDVQAICGQFCVEPAAQRRGLVAGAASRIQVSRFETAIVSLDAQKVARDQRMIRSDPGDHLFLLVQDKGMCRIHQAGKAHVLSPGDMYLVDSARPSEFVYDGANSRQVSIHLPRDELMHRFGPVCTGGLEIDRDDPLFLAMRAVLAKLFVEDGAVAPHLGEALLSLLGAYLRCLEHQAGMAEKKEEAVLSRALAVIERRCSEPDFGTADLAGELGVSPRTLQRHFSALGETVSERLLAVRLESARARLAAPATPGQSVSAIAYETGFNDLSYFYRAFRKRFGTSPGAARKTLSP